MLVGDGEDFKLGQAVDGVEADEVEFAVVVAGVQDLFGELFY